MKITPFLRQWSLVICCIISFSITSSAQKAYGLQAGQSYFTYTYDDSEARAGLVPYADSNRVSQNKLFLSAFMDNTIGEVEYRIAMSYLQKGAVFSATIQNVNTSNLSSLQVLDYVEFLLQGKRNLWQKDKLELTALLGINIGYLIKLYNESALITTVSGGDDVIYDETTTTYLPSDGINPLDIGLTAGIECSYLLNNRLALTFTPSYQYGVTDMVQRSDVYTANRGASLALGIKVLIGKE